MPQNTDISIPAGVWTQITNADVTAIWVQNKSLIADVLLKATVGAVAPTDNLGAMTLAPLMVIPRDMALLDAIPGPAGANRVYAFSDAPALVSVSHA